MLPKGLQKILSETEEMCKTYCFVSNYNHGLDVLYTPAFLGVYKPLTARTSFENLNGYCQF